MKKSAIVIIFLMLLICASSLYAQTSNITNGLTYLTTTQSPDGSWGNDTSGTETLPSTIATIEALKALNQTNTQAYSNALVWLQSQGLETTDYLAARIHTLSVSGTDADLLISNLDETYTGAWGGDDSPDVDNLDTLLALQALKKVNYTDQNIISTALFHLTSNQNPDGGWGLKQGMDSEVYYTALALQTLSQFKATFDLNTQITDATAYLLTKQNPDGGFATSTSSRQGASTVFETALSVIALIESGSTNAEAIQSAINYLTSTQLANGSWNDDPYLTALALRALAMVKPNLSISSNDIVFSNSAPKQGDTITISASIRNTGLSQADNVTVQFYDGDPNSGGIFIGETTISAISAFGSSPALISWTIPNASAHTIFVKIDPLHTVDELDETDNVASKNLTSATLPDLSIISADIDIFPPAPEPYMMTGIFGKLRNLGESDAVNVTVDFYMEAPGQNPVRLAGSGVIYSVLAGGVVDIGAAIAPEQAIGGSKTIRVTVDPQNVITEFNKTNNAAAKSFTIGASVDLSVSYADITFVPSAPRDGDIVTINSVIRNYNNGTARNIVVRHHLGDPASGGTRIGSDIIIPSLAGSSSVPVSIQFNTTGHAGNNKIYVVVDPDDAIIELNEYNNTAYRTLKVASSQGPDVTISASNISVTPSNPTTGQTVTVSATIRNIGNRDALSVPVEVHIVNSADGTSLIIGTSTIGIIPLGSSMSVQISWDVIVFSGSNQILVTVDPENQVVELDEMNNTAAVPITIAELQGADLVPYSLDLAGITSDRQTRMVSGTASVTVKNTGNQPTNTAFTITAFEDRNNNMVFDLSTDVIFGQTTYQTGLAAGTSNTVTLPVSGTVLFIDSPLYVFVDSGRMITELDETNNLICLGVFTLCRNSKVDASVKSGASWLIDRQLNVDAQGTMKAWEGSSSMVYSVLALNAYFNTGHVSQSKFVNVLNRLVGLQSPDGSWDGSTVSTSLMINNLLSLGMKADSAAISNAVSWLLRIQRADGGWGSVTETGPALIALMKAGIDKNDPVILKAAQWLKNNQNSDGYWGFNPGEPSSFWVGPEPAIALARATSPSDPQVLSAKNWYDSQRSVYQGRLRAFWLQMMLAIDPNHSAISSMTTLLLNEQNVDGGWREWPTFPLTSLRTTADVLDVLGRRGITGIKIDNGITWLDNHVNVLSETFDDSKRSNITGWALNALQSANIGDAVNLDAITKGRKALVTYQNTDGSWAGIPPAQSGWLDITAEVLFALKYPQSISPSEQAAATKAINYLISQQRADGSWPQYYAYTYSDFLTTEAVLMSLLKSGLTATHTNVSKGLSYLNTKQRADGGFDDIEYTARAAIIYKLAGATYQSRLNQSIAWLKSKQQPDGSWSNTSSTSWALIALSMAGETGSEVARGALWLVTAENQDRGWGRVMGVPISYDSSSALAIWALSLVKFTLSFNLELTTERNDYCPGDIVRITATVDKPAQDITLSGAIRLSGSPTYNLPFTLSGDLFVSEYAIPANVLPGTASLQAVGTASYGYGVSNTSFAIRNCASLKPDLSLATQDMTETAGDPFDSDMRIVSATVKNLGDQDANNVIVQFFRNAVTPEGLIESKVVTNLPAYTGAATVNTTVRVTEDTVVYVIADPDFAVDERDETNNIGTIVLIRQIPDLSVSSSDISIIPPGLAEGQPAVIAAIIHNTGNMGASEVIVSFYDGDPAAGGTLIGSITKSWIDAGSTAYAETSWNTFGQSGMNYLHILVDPLNVIHEANETNNSSLIPVDITPPVRPDLAITGTDITFSSLNPEEGAPLTLTATIRNLGIDAANVGVALYDGDPASGGQLIDMKTVHEFIPFGSTVAITFDIQTIGMAGNHKYYIALDPEHMIDEINETNNTAWSSITVGASSLGLSITTDKASYTANEDISVSLNISNQRDTVRTGTIEVKLLDAAGTVVSEATVSQTLTLGPQETQTLSFTLNTGSILAGDYRVFSQFIEAGNAVSKIDTPISIAAGREVSSAVTTDRIAYFPNQQAVITTSITSLSQNYIFENLIATVSIVDAGNQVIYTETQLIAILLPGQFAELKTYWNTATYPAGAYPITLEIRDTTGALISTSTTTLTITDEIKPSRLLRGQLSVDRQSILQGEPLTISYQVTNVGNMDISQVNLSIRTVHVVNLSVYDTLTDQSAVLMGASYANAQQLGAGAYSAKDYLVILAASINGIEETLASTYFRVEGAPSAPSLNTPLHSSDVETLTPMMSINNATDPNDDRLTYEFEVYADAGLTTLVAVSSTLEEGVSTTSWQIPATLQENAWYFWRTRAFDGRLYGQWMDPAAFRVNVTNEEPSAPTLSAPAENAFVDTWTPILAVNNATDPDSVNLTYNFVIALDPDFANIVEQQIGLFAGQGSTSWQVTVPLQENTWYYWKAQADDWLITGPWMTTAQFFVNTANEAPSAPAIIDPLDNSETTYRDVNITVSNSTDSDSAAITYLFEVDSSLTFDSPDKVSSGSVPQGQNTTSWLASGLKDNTYYYARGKANDGTAESPLSSVVGFFVNTANEAPTAPVLSNPSNGSGINTFNPVLSVHNSTDLDEDLLTYDFEVYGDAAMTNLIGSASSIQETLQITGWTVPVTLTENSTYFWRARAFDGELHSPWMALSSFTVNTANDAPTAPSLYEPAQGSSLSTLTPTLFINNAIDPDSDDLTYNFEIYSGTTLVRSVTEIPQNVSGITSVTLNALSDNTTYTWRARAYDGDRYGAWTDMSTFSIHLPSANITVTIEVEPETLNRQSHGNWITVEIELPHGYRARDIDISSIRLEGVVLAELWPYHIGCNHDEDGKHYDRDGDHHDNDGDHGEREIKVKFRRSEVLNVLPDGNRVPVHVTGLVGAVTFEGVDYIRVIH